jgi:hypothetical protein
MLAVLELLVEDELELEQTPERKELIRGACFAIDKAKKGE